MTLTLATGNARAPLRERGNDLYETPPVAVHALCRAEKLPRRIWEPACGPGAIVTVLRDRGHDVVATDLVDYACPDSQSAIDFLMERRAPDGVEAILTNPPFKLAQQFVAHALELCPLVIIMARLAFLESDARRGILDGGHLARVHVFRKRLPMMHRHGWEGATANSGMAFAWFVWDRAHAGPTELRRISWDTYDAADDFEKSIDACYEAVRERKASGGPGWPADAEPQG